MSTGNSNSVQQNNMNRNERRTIDLVELWHAILHRFWLVILAIAAGALVVYGGTKLFITPMYTSSARMLVLTKETTLSSLADLQMGTQLTYDYQELITCPPVLEQVIDDLNLDLDVKTLQERITITNPENSRVLVIAVEDEDPQMAAEITNDLAQVSSDYISETMEVVPPKIFTNAEVSEQPSSPHTMRNAAVGALLGLLIAIIFIAVSMVTNDTMASEEDVERYLGISVLASVPDRNARTRGSGKSGKNTKQETTENHKHHSDNEQKEERQQSKEK